MGQFGKRKQMPLSSVFQSSLIKVYTLCHVTLLQLLVLWIVEKIKTFLAEF